MDHPGLDGLHRYREGLGVFHGFKDGGDRFGRVHDHISHVFLTRGISLPVAELVSGFVVGDQGDLNILGVIESAVGFGTPDPRRPGVDHPGADRLDIDRQGLRIFHGHENGGDGFRPVHGHVSRGLIAGQVAFPVIELIAGVIFGGQPDLFVFGVVPGAALFDAPYPRRPGMDDPGIGRGHGDGESLGVLDRDEDGGDVQRAVGDDHHGVIGAGSVPFPAVELVA